MPHISSVIKICTADDPLTSKVLGSKGESEGRSILGFCSGFGVAGAEGMQGYGGPSLGWVTDEGDFLMEGSLFGDIPDVLVELHSVSDLCTSSQYGAERKNFKL